ncbi:MAG TPA: hypothetical protein VIK91_17840 [Nannocystis sp.]
MPLNPQEQLARIRQAQQAINKVGSSPVEAQVQFLKELMERPAEAKKFQADPKAYAVEHGILLDPRIVELVVQTAMTDLPGPLQDAAKYGPKVEKVVASMRSPGVVAAWPAAVAAGAAVVAAAAAVVTMVVTLVRAGRLQDLEALRGLKAEGIRMPSGAKFNR